jgi:hypothetical protein
MPSVVGEHEHPLGPLGRHRQEDALRAARVRRIEDEELALARVHGEAAVAGQRSDVISACRPAQFTAALQNTSSPSG